MRLLTSIADLIYPPRAAERLVRAAAPESAIALMVPRSLMLAELPATALLAYRSPLVRALIHEAKFRGSARAQRILGAVLATHLTRLCLDQPCVIVPIPLGARRRKERGYNQVEKIARAACAAAPSAQLASGLLLRAVETRPQTDLGRDARMSNMAGAFCARDLDPAYLYILVDDVLTTGATLTAAARALRSKGARRIALIALAH